MKNIKNILLAIVAALAVTAGSTMGAAVGTSPPMDTVTITYPAEGQTFNWIVGDHVSVQVKARSSAGLPLTYSVEAGYGLAPGLSINSSTGLISGTLTAPGYAGVSLIVSDTSGEVVLIYLYWEVDKVAYKGPIRLIKMGYCLDDRGNSRSNGAVVQVWRCNGLPSQAWQVATDFNAPLPGDVTIRHDGLCLAASGTANGSKVTLQPCTDNVYSWPPLFTTIVHPDFRVGLGEDNMVLDDTGYGGNGTQQQAWVNNGTKNQIWATS
jgi:Ricin-type beta-trefoil lectin domain/Putative Ig domain